MLRQSDHENLSEKEFIWFMTSQAESKTMIVVGGYLLIPVCSVPK